ncbi:MAG: DUF4394 domain-containing protein [Deltaproteobacteria bacterium]|nr:DUF4394 domain-containing protein [Deltaproteobacteria bacterium]
MRSLLATLSGLLVACGPGARGDEGTVDALTPNVDSPPFVDMSRVYAHSGTTLYRLDATTLSSLPIGSMTGIGTQSLLDLAIDKNDRMVGITRDKLYSIDPATGAATLIKDLSQSATGFTSLSFVPDPSNPTADILVSANDQGDVFRIDQSTGNAAMIGSFGTATNGKVVSSGDLIGVRGFGIYATVNVGTQVNDYLAKIDPANNWKATPLPTATQHDAIFGLGFWGGKIYGFVDKGFDLGMGTMIQIDPTTGASTDLASGSIRWFGAGVGTDAPVIL